MREAYSPHGAALLDCFRGETSAMLICHQDGTRDDVPAAFWLREAIDPLESRALDLCRGRVLDVGAGAGLHALELQRRDFEVTAIDIAPECVAIMRERGVRNAQAADLHTFDGGPFDTIICLCNGLDKIGRLAELAKKEAAGRYFGEVDLQFEYQGRSGAPFSVLHIDYETLAQIAERHGWECKLICRDGGHYLARAQPA